MTSGTQSSKIWLRFESKKEDGSIIKLRIQDLPINRMEECMDFLRTYFIKDEALHKAAGVYKTEEAIAEYKAIVTKMYEMNPPQISICCLDNDSEDFDEILGVSTVQLASTKIPLDETLSEMAAEIHSDAIKGVLYAVNILTKRVPQDVKDKYEIFYDGRGIIVRPDYRGLGIASQMIKQRRLLCIEHKVPMSSAWMTSLGSQKASERDGWETVAEITTDELSRLTGLEFGKDVPAYKLMLVAPTM